MIAAVFFANFPENQIKTNIEAIRQEVASLDDAAYIPSSSSIDHTEPDAGQMHGISISESTVH